MVFDSIFAKKYIMEINIAYLKKRLWFFGLIASFFIIYPNIVSLPCESSRATGAQIFAFYAFFVFRFMYFWLLYCVLINYNIKNLLTLTFKKRSINNLLICAAAYVVYVVIYLAIRPYGVHEYLGWLLPFQFFVICCICVLIANILVLQSAKQEKENEIERLKVENLQSKCDALTNQINPHFFFNSLSGISSLIRKKDDKKTIRYVDELADIFRYILQSGHKGMVTLREELDFIDAYRYVMEVRFANKLKFNIDIPDDKKDTLRLPVLSLLPLVENVVVHNIIDEDHKMEISISLNDKSELVIYNPIYKKSCEVETNGTGLNNLNNRFELLANREIRKEDTGDSFLVFLPLK